jgi:hypothetical protein
MAILRVGFSCNSKFFSSLIRWFTYSKVSHTYVRLSVPEFDETVIFHAAGLTVGYVNGKYFDEHQKIIEEYDVEISDFVAKEGEKARVTEAGKPYSWWQILGFLWVLAWRLIGVRCRNPFSNGRHAYVCVETVVQQLGWGVDGESLTPEDLRTMVSKCGARVLRT